MLRSGDEDGDDKEEEEEMMMMMMRRDANQPIRFPVKRIAFRVFHGALIGTTAKRSLRR